MAERSPVPSSAPSADHFKSKKLKFVSLILLIVVATFFTALAIKYSLACQESISLEDEKTRIQLLKCQTIDCMKQAVRISEALDLNYDPCLDIYNFTCGNFDLLKPLPSALLNVAFEAFLVMDPILLQEGSDLSTPIGRVANMYENCQKAGLDDVKRMMSNHSQLNITLSLQDFLQNILRHFLRTFILDLKFAYHDKRIYLYVSPPNLLLQPTQKFSNFTATLHELSSTSSPEVMNEKKFSVISKSFNWQSYMKFYTGLHEINLSKIVVGCFKCLKLIFSNSDTYIMQYVMQLASTEMMNLSKMFRDFSCFFILSSSYVGLSGSMYNKHYKKKSRRKELDEFVRFLIDSVRSTVEKDAPESLSKDALVYKLSEMKHSYFMDVQKPYFDEMTKNINYSFVEKLMFMSDFNRKLFFKGDGCDATGELHIVQYSHIKNKLILAQEFLSWKMYSPNQIQYLNLATLGFIVIKEILKDVVSFYIPINELKKCIYRRYYSDVAPNVYLDVVAADFTRKAFDAWFNGRGGANSLPGLHYSAEKLYWIALASMYCGSSDKRRNNLIATSYLNNKFNDDFKCKEAHETCTWF